MTQRFDEIRPEDLPSFFPGMVHLGAGVMAALTDVGLRPKSLLDRHQHCDWGCVSDQQERKNLQAVLDGGDVISRYLLPNGEAVWVMTQTPGRFSSLTLASEIA